MKTIKACAFASQWMTQQRAYCNRSISYLHNDFLMCSPTPLVPPPPCPTKLGRNSLSRVPEVRNDASSIHQSVTNSGFLQPWIVPIDSCIPCLIWNAARSVVPVALAVCSVSVFDPQDRSCRSLAPVCSFGQRREDVRLAFDRSLG